MSRSFSIAQGTLSPRVDDTIDLDGRAFDLTASTLKFRTRPLLSATMIVDADAVVDDAVKGDIYYDWQVGDTDLAGQYRAWWHVILPGGTTQDTPEFDLVVFAHQPGSTVLVGPIADAMRDHLPIVLDKLADAPEFGYARIQRTIDLIKYRVLGVAVIASDEGAYHPLLIDYLAKLACIEVITAGIDYWTAQYQTESINTGSNVEIETFPERIKTLRDTQARLTLEAARDYYDVIQFVTLAERRRGVFPSSNIDDDDHFVTQDPRCFPRPRSGALGILDDQRRHWGWGF